MKLSTKIMAGLYLGTGVLCAELAAQLSEKSIGTRGNGTSYFFTVLTWPQPVTRGLVRGILNAVDEEDLQKVVNQTREKVGA